MKERNEEKQRLPTVGMTKQQEETIYDESVGNTQR